MLMRPRSPFQMTSKLRVRDYLAEDPRSALGRCRSACRGIGMRASIWPFLASRADRHPGRRAADELARA